MEKNRSIHGQSLWLIKMLKIMKLTVFLMLISFVGVFASETYSQTTKLSLKVESISLEEFLVEIESQSEFRFFYTGNIDIEQRISVEFKNKKINEILDEIKEKVGIQYEVMGRQIILSPKDSKNKIKSIQQQISISGTVTDEAGNPLPGVTVLIEGTTNGTVTNTDGSYTISDVSEGATLHFSFVGMRSQDVVIGNQSTINITLIADAIGIEEVIAVGYGTMRKSDLTGVVTRIDNTKNESLPNTNVIQALRGSIPGVNISAGGNAGSGSDVSIRGQNSISGGNSALIVVDGIIYNGSISNLNPNDIESFDVLRDASSTAIFGSRAANGVILITTKKGSTKKPTVQVNSYIGVQDILMTQDFETPEQYVQKRIDYQKTLAYRGVVPEPDVSNPVLYLNDAEIENYQNGIIIDPLDKISQVAPIRNVDLSLSANKDNTSYYVSGSFTSQEGVVIGDQFKRASVRINLESTITDWLKIGTNSFFSYVDVSDSPADLRSAFHLSPYATWYLDDEEQVLNPLPMTDGLYTNPLMPTLVKLDKNRKNLFCIAYAELKIPYIEGLTYRFTYSNELGFGKEYRFVPSFNAGGVNRVANAKDVLYESQDMNLENLVKYNHIFLNDHNVDVTLLYSYNSTYSNHLISQANTFPTDVLDWYSLSLGENQITDGAYSDYHAIAMMARLNYRYKNKYLFTATGRRDGASVFSANNKFAFFPSVAFGWIISEEGFLKGNDYIDFLKLRLSYGANGNQAIGRYQSLSVIQTGYNYLFDANTAQGIAKSSLGNPDLKWESTYASNIGVDFEILKHRVSGNINYYYSRTEDLLLKRNIPTLNGFNSILSNLGEVHNRGLEIMLSTINVKKADFEWSTNFSFAKNKNEIVKLYGDKDENGNEKDDIANRWFIGKSLGAYYNYQTEGIWQIGDDIPEGFRAGDYKIKDLNGDGSITPDEDRKIIGYNRPDWTFGFNTSLKYKGFTLYTLVNGSVGGERDNADILDPSTSFSYRGRNQVADWWTPENPSTTTPSMDYQDGFGLNWLQDISFVRIQDISLSYDFSKKAMDKLKMNNLQVYVSSKNPFLFSKWGGWDPETSGTGKSQYPTMKSIIVGVKFSL